MREGWEVKKLIEVCEKITDGTHQTPTYFDDGVLFLSSRNVTSGTIDWENVKYIDAKQHGEMQRRVSPRLNDILLAKNGTTGVAAMVDRDVPFDIYVSLALLRPLATVHPTFLLHFINSPLAKKQFTKRLKGVGVPNLHLEEIREVEIPIPPLPEQQRIVGILDKAFAGLAVAVANAEKNLQNARALFESHLQSVFTQRGEGWVDRQLKEVCEKITDGTHQTPKYFDEGVVFLSSRNVTSGTIDWDRIKYIDMNQHLEMHKRIAPRRNDILLAKNGTTGVAAIVDRDTIFDIYVSLALLRPLPVIRPRFLLHFINSPTAKVQFNKRLKGVGVPNLHLEEIREVRLVFPADLEAQDRVVDELDSLRTETKRLAAIYERKLAALVELKKSLLHQAFGGEL